MLKAKFTAKLRYKLTLRIHVFLYPFLAALQMPSNIS